MNNKFDSLTAMTFGGLIIGSTYVFDIGNVIYLILAIISFIISIIVGCLKFAALIKKAKEDGNITHEELKSIADEISAQKQEIDNAASNIKDNK